MGLSSRPNCLETKSRLVGAVFVSKSTGCFTMKQMTYPEELLLGTVQFSLQKKMRTITNEKHMDYREEFLLGRYTLPTLTGLSIICLLLVWCIFFATFFCKKKTQNYSFQKPTPPWPPGSEKKKNQVFPHLGHMVSRKCGKKTPATPSNESHAQQRGRRCTRDDAFHGLSVASTKNHVWHHEFDDPH